MLEIKQWEWDFVVIPHINTGHGTNQNVEVTVVHIPTGKYCSCSVYSTSIKNKLAAIDALEKHIKEEAKD